MPGVCPRCNREVYFAEEKLALGKVWHTFCFSCRSCRKLLNSCNVVTHLSELFCKNCYIRLFLSTANHAIKAIPNSSATLALSKELLNCYCCDAENSIGNASLNRNQHYQSDKYRLRGGGSEVEETNICLEEEKKHFIENECANLGIVNSMTTICDPPPSPTAITTWYNRQHSRFRSTLSPEWQKNNTNAKDCRFEVQKQDTDQFEPKTSFSNNEVNITEAQLSTDKTQVTSINWNNKINKYDPVYEFSANSVTIPSRRKFAYPPVPPPRNPLPSRRRVSFYDVVFGDMRGNDQNCISKMQDDHHRPCCNNDNKKEYNNSFDIWQADESVGKNDGGYENINVNYTKDSGRMHFEKSASDCGEEDTLSKCNDIEKSRGQDHCIEGNSESRAYRIMNEKDDASSKEDAMTYGHQSGPNSSNELDDNERMRGGCGGPCGPRVRLPCGTVKVETACLCKREPEPCRVVTSCATCATTPCADRRSCCSSSSDRPVCKKSIIKCRPPCIGESPTCGGGGCCGGGCRGGCGKPGQTCLPNPSRLCTTPCRPCSPCSPPKPCAPQIICYCGQKCGNCCGSGNRACCCRSKSPVCRNRSRRCCSTERAEPIVIESGCCRPKSGCECLGGGVDCQRCGRKVYQAEMQIVSGMPFHNTCFSCYCCRKPLEPLTYQENCGEIYCKQCYVRNFGPQGYGYGVGPGTLQTPM